MTADMTMTTVTKDKHVSTWRHIIEARRALGIQLTNLPTSVDAHEMRTLRTVEPTRLV